MEGFGTESSPYLVKTADDLFDIRADLSAYYMMVNDIDLTAWLQEENPKQGWTPIGTEVSPFTGVFDGNNKTIKGLFINKPDMDNVGFFGYVADATIKNFSIINPKVVGKNNVGTVVGTAKNNGHNIIVISDIICIGGAVKGNSCIGGIAGKLYTASTPQWDWFCIKNTIQGNYSSSNISGDNCCGGIIGQSWGWGINYNTSYTHVRGASVPLISDNSFSGRVDGKEYVGGIAGKAETPRGWVNNPAITIQLDKNLSSGSVFGENATNGIFGGYDYYKYEDYFSITHCVCAADTVSGTNPYRIFSESFPDNFGLTTTVMIKNGKQVDIEDNEQHGTSLGKNTLRRKNTYVGMGFDFDEQWAVSEGESFPYNINQSAPPAITSCMTIGGSTIVSGTAPADGTIYVFVGDKMYEGNITNGNWDVMLSKLTKGTKIKASADTDSKMPSVFASYVVEDGADSDIDTPTDSIYVRPASAVRGSKAPLYICMKNEQAASSYIFDLALPKGLTIDSYILSSRHDEHSVSMNREEGTDVYNISVEANPSKEIKGKDGTVIVLMVNTTNVPCGKHFLMIQNAKYSAISDANPVELPDTKTTLSIEETVWGDLNGDGSIDVADIATIIEIMAHQSRMQ